MKFTYPLICKIHRNRYPLPSHAIYIAIPQNIPQPLILYGRDTRLDRLAQTYQAVNLAVYVRLHVGDMLYSVQQLISAATATRHFRIRRRYPGGQIAPALLLGERRLILASSLRYSCSIAFFSSLVIRFSFRNKSIPIRTRMRHQAKSVRIAPNAASAAAEVLRRHHPASFASSNPLFTGLSV